MPVDEALPQLSSNAVLISSVVDLQKNITRLSDEISIYEKKIVKNYANNLYYFFSIIKPIYYDRCY